MSCGDDGRVVVADCFFWKVKDYFSSEKLQTLEMVVQIVTDARRQVRAIAIVRGGSGHRNLALLDQNGTYEFQ